MTKQTSSTALAIVQALRNHPETNGLPYNWLLGYSNDFLENVERDALGYKILNSPAPASPGDNPPTAKEYPRRETLKPTPEPVPGPAETETVEQVLKTSLPDYGAPKELLQAIGQTVRAAEKLFEAATETDQDKTEKENKRRDVFGWLDETRQAVHGL